MPSPLLLNGQLTLEALVQAARDPRTRLACTPDALTRVEASEQQIKKIRDEYVRSYRAGETNSEAPAPLLDYGVTTGFGEFKRVPIAPEHLDQLQINFLLSHAAGVGVSADPRDLSNYYPADVVRAALLLRLNTFLLGHSGVSRALVETLVQVFNQGVVPLVPIRGSVGSSGDLCPLAHLALVLFAEGRERTWFYQVTESAHTLRHPGLHFSDGSEPTPGAPPCLVRPAADVPIRPHVLRVKEALALTNGATFSAAMLALAVFDAEQLMNAADVALSLSLEAMRGCARAFDPAVHALRGQIGQAIVAGNVRRLVTESALVESSSEVQDAYSIRCAPAVHGASRDALALAKTVVIREINAVTDNPLFFQGTSGWDREFEENWTHRFDKHGRRVEYDGTERHSFSAGNFHGQPVGMAADYLAIALAELGNISERRTQSLLDDHHSRGLPANLVPNGGLNSGFMIAQYTAASLVSENKVFAHPASVDSIPTSSNSEDHNAMATIAAVKLRHVLALTQFTVGIELLVAAQGVEWATLLVHEVWPAAEAVGETRSRPKEVTDYLMARHVMTAPAGFASWIESHQATARLGDAELALFEWWTRRRASAIPLKLGIGTRAAYRKIREGVKDPLTKDRFLSPQLTAVTQLVTPGGESGTSFALVDAVNAALGQTAPLKPSHTFQAVDAPDR